MFYVAYLETDPCYFRRIFFRSYSLDECKKYVILSKTENLYIFNNLNEIVE